MEATRASGQGRSQIQAELNAVNDEIQAAALKTIELIARHKELVTALKDAEGDVSHHGAATAGRGVITERDIGYCFKFLETGRCYFKDCRYIHKCRTGPPPVKKPKPATTNVAENFLGLPVANEHNSKSIPINSKGQRLDFFVPTPTEAEWSTHSADLFYQNICRHNLLGNACGKSPSPHHLHNVCLTSILGYECTGAECENMKHIDVDEVTKHCMRYKLLQTPCAMGGTCRRKDCLNGHVCQNKNCLERLSMELPLGCKMSEEAHGLETKSITWVSETSVSTSDSLGEDSSREYQIHEDLIDLIDL